MTRTAAVLVLWIGFAAFPATASAKWTRLTSEHFVFIGDGPDRDLRRTANRLEQFRDVVERVLSDGATHSPVPTVVIVFQNDRAFTPYKPVFRGKPVAVAGVFAGGEDVNYIAVNVEQDSDAYGVVFHEYAHFIVRNAIGNPPVWVNEGLAELYQTFESQADGRTALLGKASEANLRLLRAASRLIPIDELIAVDAGSSLYNEDDRRRLFYAESWALAHYLTFGSTPRAGQLKTYLSKIADGEPASDAFHQAFGTDTSALQRELQAYVRALTFRALRVEFDEAIQRSALSPAESIADSEAAAYLGDLIGRLNRLDDARALLRKTIDSSPDAARAMAVLGMLELRASNNEAAFPLLERAASLAPGLASIQGAYGRALTIRAARGATDDDALYAKARTALSRALELEPDNASTMVTLAEVEMATGVNPDRAVTLMRQVVSVAPGREEYRLMLAEALAMAANYDEATRLLGVLIARGSRAEIRDGARRLLSRVADARNTLLDLAAGNATDARGSTPPAADPNANEPRRETMVQGAFVPTLRAVQAGETRVLGSFVAVDCRPNAIVLQVDTASGPVRMAVQSFNQVEFLTYRQDSPESVPCGPQARAYRVLATFRTDAPIPGANTPNRAVAIELLPDGYELK